ncbi:MAG: nucleoside triphosphate pyrophosphohydrolase [Omnitrophica WOR_2 bacterium RIFCSPLOWO2_02_FULL_50_19]|nr:MAG: nucleoside triphosphate pyrophosphohydrolase [Omnitrophica WOR_2 bacterium RIFCSPLOWO2_02_FULL_50_19]
MIPKSFEKLVKIMARLRAKNGCPWDRAQTHSSLKKHIIEEAYELCDAIDSKDSTKLKDELGDFLFQVIFQAQIAKERGAFDIDDVLRASAEKMFYRHPHVFGKHKARDPDDAYKHWQSRKEQEKSYKDRKNILDGVPKTLPALIKAQKVSRRAAHQGFDWPDISFVVDKVHEELEEVKAEIKSGNKRRLSEEIGDLLFVIVILSRFGGVDAEESLHSATKKFARRFKNIERALKKRNKKFTECTFEELYRLWRINR